MKKIIYKCKDFYIEEIPLNYKATITCALNPEHNFRKMGRHSYTHPEHGLDYAKEIVQATIDEYFMAGLPKDHYFNKNSRKALNESVKSTI